MNIWFISKYGSIPQYAKAPPRLYFIARESVKLGNTAQFIISDANHLSNFPDTEEIYNDVFQDGVNIRWIKTRKYNKTASSGRILSWLNFEWKLFSMKLKEMSRPDVVVVSSLSIFTVLYGYYLKKRFHAFLVFEIRDIWPLTMTAEAGFSKWHPLVLFIGMIEKFGYRKADLVVGTMPRLDLHIKNILGYERPFFCSPLGFEPSNYTKESVKQENPFLNIAPVGKVIVGYAGSMGITNALGPFIETIKLLHKNEHIYFLLVGEGDLKETFENQLREFNNVTFLPRINQHEVKYFLDVCDILYLSTHHSKVWAYGQSMNKVVEYMLAAKPIIASYSGYPSMINEAHCGLFVNSTDAEDLKNVIVKFAEMSEEERLQMGRNGRDWVWVHRSYSLLAKEYLKAIETIRNRRL